MGAQKIQSYGVYFTKIISDFMEEQGITKEMTTEMGTESVQMTVETTTAAPARKRKQPFYIAPEKLAEVELTDTCMISDLTNRINALCEDKDRKKLTASFVNQLLVQEGYLEEVTEGEEKVKSVTEKGKAAGIREEERRGRYGTYYALIHTRESQGMVLEVLKAHFAEQ